MVASVARMLAIQDVTLNQCTDLLFPGNVRRNIDCNQQGGLATASDLAAFRLSMIAPVKKYVNHSGTVASMRETG